MWLLQQSNLDTIPFAMESTSIFLKRFLLKQSTSCYTKKNTKYCTRTVNDPPPNNICLCLNCVSRDHHGIYQDEEDRRSANIPCDVLPQNHSGLSTKMWPSVSLHRILRVGNLLTPFTERLPFFLMNAKCPLIRQAGVCGITMPLCSIRESFVFVKKNAWHSVNSQHAKWVPPPSPYVHCTAGHPLGTHLALVPGNRGNHCSSRDYYSDCNIHRDPTGMAYAYLGPTWISVTMQRKPHLEFSFNDTVLDMCYLHMHTDFLYLIYLKNLPGEAFLPPPGSIAVWPVIAVGTPLGGNT